MSTERFEKNLKAMRHYQPHMARRIEAMVPPYSKVVGRAASGDLNIDLGHTRFYKPNATAFTADQVKAFVDKPDQRISLGWPIKPDERKFLWRKVIGDSLDRLEAAGQGQQTQSMDPDGGYLVVFGLGLGLHLEPLIERLDVRSVIIVEQYDEFLLHAMHEADFAKVLDIIDQRKGTVQFLFSDVPINIANYLFYLMRHDAFGLIDGSYIYTHYDSYVLQETKRLFVERLPVLMGSPGFFEDELVMMTNCVENMAQSSDYLFADKLRYGKQTPILICGSGPSIDSSVELIRKHKDDCFVMSCGTGLGALLGHGIVPDFHVEVENTPGPAEILSKLAETFDLSSIVLISTNTVHPDLARHFNKRIFYFRDSVSSSKIFAGRFGQIYFAAPTVANAASRIALGFGFHNVFLLGVDLGARDASKHHSEKSVYLADESFLDTHPDHLAATKYTIEAPGNLGGRVRTNHSFLYAGIHFSAMIAQFKNATVYNCSDGIRITGTIPKLLEAAQIKPAEDSKQREWETIWQELDRAPPQEIISPARLTDLTDALVIFYLSIRSVINSVDSANVDLRLLFDEFKDLLDDPTATEADRAVQQIHSGTMMNCYNFLYQTYRRLPQEAREPFFIDFRDTLLQAIDAMEEQTTALTEKFLNRVEAA